MRFSPLIRIAAILLLMQASSSAQAGLIATPANNVTVLFFLGAHVAGDEEIEGSDVAIGLGGADFAQGVEDGVTIAVGTTQITMTNQLPSSMPFCSGPSSPCTDSFTGFEFLFSSGVDIIGVAVDPASAAVFPPNTTPPHDGLQLLSPTDILLDVTGDAPNIGDELVLDLSFPSTSSVPEPTSLTLLIAGILGCWAAGLRGKRRRILA
jgi:hypothetical protein